MIQPTDGRSLSCGTTGKNEEKRLSLTTYLQEANSAGLGR